MTIPVFCSLFQLIALSPNELSIDEIDSAIVESAVDYMDTVSLCQSVIEEGSVEFVWRYIQDLLQLFLENPAIEYVCNILHGTGGDFDLRQVFDIFDS